jgi:hypothetical protein
MSMILLVKSCHHDPPATRRNQTADHLISRVIGKFKSTVQEGEFAANRVFRNFDAKLGALVGRIVSEWPPNRELFSRAYRYGSAGVSNDLGDA